MTNFPISIDTDLELERVEDNITEIGAQAINSLRDAVFAIEYTLGINPQGSASDVSSFLTVSHNADGTIKAASLSGLGLITLPITSGMFADYTIPEIKLVLDHTTASLYADIQSALADYISLYASFTILNADFSKHIYGVEFVADGYLNRHVASHIDINDGTSNGGIEKYVGIDIRDLSYYNSGLLDTDGYIRNADTVMDALIQINSDFLLHALSLDGYHPASFISLDTALYETIPRTANTVQKAFDFLDSSETVIFNEHRAELHSTGIPRHHNVTTLVDDGYNLKFGPFACESVFLDTGKSYLIFLNPGNASLDWAFKQLSSGDFVKINYGGFEAKFPIESLLYTPGSVYEVTIDGYNIIETVGAFAIFEKATFDDNHYGILAVSPAMHNYYFNPANPTDGSYPSAGRNTNLGYVPASAIIVTPNCASATGIDLSLDDLDSSHYKLYVGFYPNADPTSNAIIPTVAIKSVDVTGNLGATPGLYTLQQIIDNTNREFRKGGYNYRLVAFEYKGQFGLAIPDIIDNPGFSIISGVSISRAGAFTNNVVDVANPTQDPLGLGALKADVASPVYSSSNLTPVKVFVGRKSNKYNMNGQFIDYLAPGFETNTGNYYDAFFIETNDFGGVIRQRGVFRINKDLSTANIYPGSTITIHPIAGANYSALQDYYGRFIVESVDTGCLGYTEIWTVDCCSWNGNPTSSLPLPTRANPTSWVSVKLYFSSDSVSFRNEGNYKDYYEINITKDGSSFAHRRAAMPLQTATATHLDTTIGLDYTYLIPYADVINYGWHISEVSSKLRGFSFVGSTSSQRYVRFVAISYDAVTKSYEGYICQPSVTAPFTTNVGQTIRVKSGEVGRYYDNTGIDYIDILFEDDPANPLDPNIARNGSFVDIEIFESIKMNEQYLCLASCEKLTNGRMQSSVWNFTDRRQFGTISERVLTTSALSYIESGDRWLHQNGVLNGFDFISYQGTFATFNGGSALINGTVVNANNFTVYPMNIWVPGFPDITFALCIKDDGTHELLPLYTSSILMNFSFGITGVPNEYRRTYTIAQIIEERKDLLPIYEITITSGAEGVDITSAPIDIRKFIANNEVKNSLVLYNTVAISGTTLPLGNFNSWIAVSNYIKATKSLQNTVLVRGETTIDETIDFGGIPVTIIGDSGNIVNCKVIDGVNLSLNSNMIVRNINFVRATGGDAAAMPYVPSIGTIGLVLDSLTTGTYSNITVDGCTFATLTGWRRSGAAHILFEKTGDNAVFHNINITNNSFLEEMTQLDIAFVNRLGLAARNTAIATIRGAVLINVTIDNNSANVGSWSLLSSDNDTGSTGAGSVGLGAYGVKIINNHFDYLWLNLSAFMKHGFLPATFVDLPAVNSGVFINNNNFVAIQGKTIAGIEITGSDIVKLGSPNTIISNNRLSLIKLPVNMTTAIFTGTPFGDGDLIIESNTIQSCKYVPTLFLPTDQVIGADNGIAIRITTNQLTACRRKVIINGNTIISEDTDNYYGFGIMIEYLDAIITNNIIDDFRYVGILYTRGAIGSFIVSNNILYRRSNNVSAYIYLNKNLSTANITDNIFDSSTINGTSTAVVYCSDNTNTTIERNKNQEFTIAEGADVIWARILSYSTDLNTYSRMYLGSGPTAVYELIQYCEPLADNTPMSGLILNLPLINGATPISLSMDINITRTDLFMNLAIYPAIYSKYDSSTTEYFNIYSGGGFMGSEAPVIPATIDRDAAWHTVVFDLSSFIPIYATQQSSERKHPLFFALLDDEGGGVWDLIDLHFSAGPPAKDVLQICKIKVTYRY